MLYKALVRGTKMALVTHNTTYGYVVSAAPTPRSKVQDALSALGWPLCQVPPAFKSSASLECGGSTDIQRRSLVGHTAVTNFSMPTGKSYLTISIFTV
ncbi:hypothetical protein DICVIV_01994 [Dictyocaulus viviparus]|uniref:Uncharacterized protein n=1 Tax=Dictyocaulus viviparus TaxID=29172 RepID=A0A0D8Y4M4_DICVI|nr:hypothetical protein DICVIV_01994 [Dictyocaulus viviparus]